MGRDIQITLPVPVPRALNGLPPASAVFTGRDNDVQAVLETLRPEQTDAPVLSVAGMAGVGKTELVLQAADEARRNGWFPGGVLFVDMLGYDTRRELSAEAALAGLLAALGVAGKYIPGSEADRSRLFRSALAALSGENHQILLIIDNAATAAQVTPLLPTDDGTRVLVTSRHTLDVGARLYDLTILDQADSVRLLAGALHQARGAADVRIRDEAGAAAEVAALCAGLPLALRICGALLADQPTRPVSSLAGRLAAEHTRLDNLSRENKAVRAVFELSYRHLDDQQAHLFRSLSVNRGPDIGTDAVAAMLELRPDVADRAIQGLARAHLVEPGLQWGRWRTHDLLRLYSDELSRAAADERRHAVERLLGYYSAAARAAESHLLPPPAERSPWFRGRDEAMAWFEDERRNLVEASSAAADEGNARVAFNLAFTLGHFLRDRRYFDDLITVSATARDIARARGDSHGEGGALGNMAMALTNLRRYDEALTVHRQAIDALGDAGDLQGQGMALNNIGRTLTDLRRFDEAGAAHEEAATIFRTAGDRYQEAAALTQLGGALHGLRRFDEAISAKARAATMFSELGDRLRAATSIANLGITLIEARRTEAAIRAYQHVIAIFQALGERHYLGMAFNSLGSALTDADRPDEAIEAHERAAVIFRDTAERHSEGIALNNLGSALRAAGRPGEAIEAHRQAVAIYRETKDRHREGSAWNNLGMALWDAGRPEEALSALRKDLEICRATGDRHGEGTTLDNVGLVLADMLRLEDADRHWALAVDAFTDTGDHERAALVRHRLRELPSS
ncbi:tetratricopeptide repeat protein [Actinoplanes sp. NPDC049265]|uniref:tetratricopeptide repeat protein n=1 Tax=Actinoplanes sp. NPDC049265 TaxID=3363902 RepID=UPI003722BCAB